MAAGKETRQSSGSSSLGFVELNPWWEVDLGSCKPIHSLEIHKVLDRTERDYLSDFYIFISNHEFGDQSLTEIRGDSSVQRIDVEENVGNIISVNGIKGRYVRIQLKTTNILSLAEVKVYLDIDRSAIPYAKDTSASFNKSEPNTISYGVYTNGTEISAVFIDGNEVPADSYHIENKDFVRNAFLAPNQMNEYLDSVGESNRWYPYVKATLESMKEAPTTVAGKALVLNKNYLSDTVEIGKHTVTLWFDNGMELVVDLDVN
ncbi:F5/8 type C domain protein [compost metagenome]